MADGNDGGLARLIGRRFNKGCVLLYYSSSEFRNTLAVYLNGVGAAGLSCTDHVIWNLHCEWDNPPEGHSEQFAYTCVTYTP